MNKEIPDRYQFFEGKDENKGNVHSIYHYVESHQGNEEPEIQHDFYHRRHRKRKHDGGTLHGELRKLKPPTFDGEKSIEIIEIWILEMKKYLELHDYFDNQEAQIAIYNLQEKG